MKKSAVRGLKSEVRVPKGEGEKKDSSRPNTSHREDRGPGTSDSELRTLIVGYGNPLRSDDALGWHASRLVAKALAGKDVELVTCHQLTPELSEPLSKCQRAVFIDADANGEPGEIHRRVLLPEAPASSSFTHTCTPSGLLASAQQLYGCFPEAITVTVTAQSFEFGDSLTAVVSAVLPNVVKIVLHWLGANCEARP